MESSEFLNRQTWHCKDGIYTNPSIRGAILSEETLEMEEYPKLNEGFQSGSLSTSLFGFGSRQHGASFLA